MREGNGISLRKKCFFGLRQHFLRYVQPKEFCLRKHSCNESKISSRSAANLKHGLPWLWLYVRNGPVTPDEIVFPGKIINMPLRAIHAIHFYRMFILQWLGGNRVHQDLL